MTTDLNRPFRFYVLQNDRVIEVESFEAFVRQFDETARIIKKTFIGNEIEISTAFLGIAHGFRDEFPLVFETMIFGGSYNEQCLRYTTKDQALEDHYKIACIMREELAAP